MKVFAAANVEHDPETAGCGEADTLATLEEVELVKTLAGSDEDVELKTLAGSDGEVVTGAIAVEEVVSLATWTQGVQVIVDVFSDSDSVHRQAPVIHGPALDNVDFLVFISSRGRI